MRHGTSSPARALTAVGLALALAPFAASAAFAGTRQAEPIEVVGNAQNKFDPVDVTATPDKDGNITVTLVSEGAPHTWENKDLGIDSGLVNAGDEKTFTFKAPAPGKHKVICSLHESVGMIGSLTVEGEGQPADPDDSPTAAPSSQPPASGTASPSVGAGGGHAAPTPGEGEHAEDEHAEDEHAPGIAGNEMLKRIEAERAAQQGAVSGFKFFTFVCVAFLFILGAAILFSTRSRRTPTSR